MATIAEQTLATQQAQLDRLSTVNESVLSVTQAVANLQAAVLVALQAGALVPQSILDQLAALGVTFSGSGSGAVVGSGGTNGTTPAGNLTGTSGTTWTTSEIRTWGEAMIAAGNAMGVYDRLRSENVSAATFDSIMGWSNGTTNAWAAANGLQQFAGGGYASGLAMVGERGPEIVDFATPGRVYSSGQTREFMSNAGIMDSGLSSLLTRLINEVEFLREENISQARMYIDAARESAKEGAEMVGERVGSVVRRGRIEDRQRRMAKAPI